VLVDPHYPRNHLVDTPAARVVRLINLVAQSEAGWDTPKEPPAEVVGATLRLRRERAAAPLVATASRTSPVPSPLPSRAEGDVDVFGLPSLGAWTVVLVMQP
jgi:hypothetical protein